MSAQLQTDSQQIVHFTAAAAAKAAATALLTNQIVRRVQVNLPDGRTVSFKVDKCVLESGSALCSVAGTRLGSDVPEVCVRVAWEKIYVKSPASAPHLSGENGHAQLNGTSNQTDPEVIWLRLENDLLDVATDTPPDPKIDLTKPLEIHQIPLFLHFDRTADEPDDILKELPRELLAEAVREALTLYPAQKLEHGVQVFVSLVANEAGTVGGLPQLQTYEPTQPLFETPPAKVSRLALALDDFGSEALTLLVNDEDSELMVDLPGRQLNLKAALDQLGTVLGLDTLTVGGGPSAIIALANGDFTSLSLQNLDSFFVAAVAQRKDLDRVVVQSLREATSSHELIQILNRRRLGWLFDELCRLACTEIRKRLSRSLRLELMIIGTTGAVLGRAFTEPASFKL